MIERIFQDLDECILHTFVNNVPYDSTEYVEFKLGADMHIYHAVIRPCAKKLFEYYNSVVGKDNVYILTSATYDYATELNRLGEFGLDADHIFSREDIQQYNVSWRFGDIADLISLASPNNVLIDNLPSYLNKEKMSMMGITKENYHQTPEYYGNNLNERYFMEDIKEFIKARQ